MRNAAITFLLLSVLAVIANGIAAPKLISAATARQCAELAASGDTSATAKWCAHNGYSTQYATGFIR